VHGADAVLGPGADLLIAGVLRERARLLVAVDGVLVAPSAPRDTPEMKERVRPDDDIPGLGAALVRSCRFGEIAPALGVLPGANLVRPREPA
jgi:hypothetical protein